MHTCRCCGQEKEDTAYYGKYNRVCKDCMKAARRRLYATNEMHRIRAKQYSAKQWQAIKAARAGSVT